MDILLYGLHYPHSRSRFLLVKLAGIDSLGYVINNSHALRTLSNFWLLSPQGTRDRFDFFLYGSADSTVHRDSVFRLVVFYSMSEHLLIKRGRYTLVA